MSRSVTWDFSVIPAKAGISSRRGAAASLHEIPAFAGMTNLGLSARNS